MSADQSIIKKVEYFFRLITFLLLPLYEIKNVISVKNVFSCNILTFFAISVFYVLRFILVVPFVNGQKFGVNLKIL